MTYQKIKDGRRQLVMFKKGLVDPRQFLRDCIMRCDELSQRMHNSMKRLFKDKQMKLEMVGSKATLMKLVLRGFQDRKSKLSKAMSLLDSLSPLKVVDRGYAIVHGKDKVIKSIKDVKKDDSLTIQVSDGKIDAQVTKTKGGK